MQKLILGLLLTCLTTSCFAFTGSYAEAQALAKKQFNSHKINETRTECNDLKLLFIQNTDQCGNINCPYLAFKQVGEEYVSLGDIGFAAVKLICYPNKQYLVTSWHESNAASEIQLYQMQNDTLQNKNKRNLDLANKTDNAINELIWSNNIKEMMLLEIFK